MTRGSLKIFISFLFDISQYIHTYNQLFCFGQLEGGSNIELNI